MRPGGVTAAIVTQTSVQGKTLWIGCEKHLNDSDRPLTH